MPQNYQQLLLDDRWKYKRQEILDRDSNSCQRCGCSAETKYITKRYDFERHFEYNIEFLEFPNGKQRIAKISNANVFEIFAKCKIAIDFIDKNQPYTLVVNFGKIDIKYNCQYSMSIDYLGDENLYPKEYPNKDLVRAVNRQIDYNSMSIDLENIWFAKLDEVDQYIKDPFSLHVHHKCYRSNIEIWNQHNSEYITLCNICHNTIHSNQMIPFYDKYQNITHYFTACDRCNGSGNLPHFKHIQNGLCFKCKGERYFEVKNLS